MITSEALAERELVREGQDAGEESGSGMVAEESGLRVYRTGRPLSATLVDEAIRQRRQIG